MSHAHLQLASGNYSVTMDLATAADDPTLDLMRITPHPHGKIMLLVTFVLKFLKACSFVYRVYLTLSNILQHLSALDICLG